MVTQDNNWWRMTAGHGGSLAIDWLEQDIVTVGRARSIGDFREQSAEELVEKSKEAGAGRQVARFLGKQNVGMVCEMAIQWSFMRRILKDW